MQMQKKKDSAVYNAAAYLRISKEDVDLVSESSSIANQKQMILDFVKEKKDINLVSIRIDDGYSGTNFAGVR